MHRLECKIPPLNYVTKSLSYKHWVALAFPIKCNTLRWKIPHRYIWSGRKNVVCNEMCRFKHSAMKIELTVPHLNPLHPQYKAVDEHKPLEVAPTASFYIQSDLLHFLWDGLPNPNPVKDVAGEDWSIILVFYHKKKLTFNFIFIYKRLYSWVSKWCPSHEFSQIKYISIKTVQIIN